MLCEKYKDAVIDAAVSGEELAPALRAHVGSCARCATELAQQRSLVAAIESNLSRQENAPVPAATLQRFDAHLAQQPQPKRSPRLVSIFVGAFAAMAAAAMTLAFLSYTKVQTTGSKTATLQNGNANQGPVHEASPARMTATQEHTPRTSKEMRRRTARVMNASTRRPEPEVLVPPDERIAMEHFIADLHGSGEIALARAKRVTEQREQAIVPVDAPDIQIVALKVSPIRDTEMGSDR